MTKKNILFISLIGTIVIVIIAILSLSGFCYHNQYCLSFFKKFDPWNFVNYILFAPPPLLLLSLLTYRMRDEVFRAWTAFAVWWVPLSVIAILVTPRESGGFISIPLQATLAVLCAGVFLLVSLIIIGWKYYSLKK